MITEDYVSFETAKRLKEKGFNEECSCFYNNIEYGTAGLEVDGQLYYKNSALDDEEYAAPTLQMVMKWLREVHCIFIEPTVGETNGKTWYDFDIIPINKREIVWNHYDSLPFVECNSYEEACEAAIKYCLENLI